MDAVTDHVMNLSTSTTSDSSCEELEDEQTADDPILLDSTSPSTSKSG